MATPTVVEPRPALAPAPSTARTRWLRRPSTPTLVVAVGTAALVALNAWWWFSHRRGFPMFIDESFYTTVALDHTDGFHRDRIAGLVEAFRDQRTVAPLVPLLTVPAQLVLGESIGPGFMVILAFYALLVFGTYWVAREITRAPWAAFAALVVAVVPETLTYARMYYFAVPSAALFTIGLTGLVRADGLRRPWWAVGGGVALGLAALSRTLMMALVPLALVAAVLQAVARGTPWRRWLAVGAASGAATLVVAATWYAGSLDTVVDYLRVERRGAYRPGGGGGAGQGTSGTAFRQVRQLADSFYIPLGLLLAAAIAAGLVWVFRRRGAGPAATLVRRAAGSNAGLLTLVLTGAVVVFAVAQEAFGQWLPVLPAVVTLAVAGLAGVPRRATRRGLAAAIAVVSLLNLVMLTDVVPALGRPRRVDAGPLGRLTVTDGRQFVEEQLAAFGHDTGHRPGRLPEQYEQWSPLNRELAAFMRDYATARGERPVIFESKHQFDELVTLNDLHLADRLRGEQPEMFVGILVYYRPAPLDSFRDQLTSPQYPRANFVVSVDPVRRAPRGTDPLDAAAKSTGYELVRTVELPDGREARVWWRSLSAIV